MLLDVDAATLIWISLFITFIGWVAGIVYGTYSERRMWISAAKLHSNLVEWTSGPVPEQHDKCAQSIINYIVGVSRMSS